MSESSDAMANHSLRRRHLLKTAAAAWIAGLSGTLGSPTLSAKPRSSGRIDVQIHYYPPFYADLSGGPPPRMVGRWSVPNALAYMDNNSVSAGVLSVSAPGVDFLAPAESVSLARRLNESAAEVVQGHPDRFGVFATLPMQDVEATLAEIAYCLDVLKMDGVCMMSNVKGHYLGHARFAPILDELDRRKAVIFVHPTHPTYAGKIEIAEVAAEWPFDTCRAAIDLIYSGTLRRCTNLKIILAHAGGALPAVARRIEETARDFSTTEPKVTLDEAIAQVAGFYFDLAISAHENIISALRGISTLDHVLFGCDWPFAQDDAIKWNVDAFDRLKLTAAERYAIERGNAARLFPRLVKSA